MLFKSGQIDRERIAGAIIIISLFMILLTVIGIQFLNVKVTNIELIDRGLYSVITEKGPVNIGKEDVLRIERTYTKASMTGAQVELDKIYTTKGFIFISSLDPYYKNGKELINSVDFDGDQVWVHPSNGSAETSIEQRQNANLKLIQPFSYAIGTSTKLISVIFSVISLQYLSLAIGGLALLILIFPLRLEGTLAVQSLLAKNPEYSNEDEQQLDAIAK
ncbi:hypothetical protein [Desulfosporosinus hippei]|uniref:Uncharacterized protein n=1 Tax=Desulfosporosinus hippei DSM 8344 TaxID=1121419 RepID=A0A1G8A1X2_9FIRM|nr:hypothetical protein [Desulfosporosinus hippei]SDH14942.1 hypothetical protein SAMN05443529_11080 [Desulfosporosinus hippei DSM 8344]